MKWVLGGLLLTSIVLLVPATIAVFTVRSQRRERAGTGLVRAVLAAIVVAVLALVVSALLGLGPARATLGAAVLGGSVLAWSPVAHRWAARGLVAWALTLDAVVLYLTYVALWTASADLGVIGTIASVALLLLEVFVFLIGVGYMWELVDVLARRSWSSYVDLSGPPPAGTRPFVSLHVPTHNEPPDLVIETLESLLTLEYSDYEVLVVDNNTDDPSLWQPVEAFCSQHARFRFLHLIDWPGYKSGALNEALRVSDPRAEVIGIIDADYQVEPDFLARCAPLFERVDVAFVQTPQDYREWDAAPYFRRLYYSYGYFFDVSQRSRNERNGAIFGGTMGLIRRSALEGVGGWDEWCITEDAELSLRLLRAGGRGIHVDQSFGRGIMPLTFETLKRQRFRWCFGGIQILRMHWRSLVPGRRTDENRLTLAQRWAYFVGSLQWFGDLAALLFTGFLLVGALDAVLGAGLVVRRLSGVLLVCVAVLVVLGALRSLALLRRTSGATWGESLGAFGLWLALGWTVAQASFRGLFAREGAFLRTPKVRGELGWRDAWRGNRLETVLGLGCLLVAVWAASLLEPAAMLVGALLGTQGAGYLSAPLNSVAAIRSDLPEELRRRRRELLTSWGRPAARRGGYVLAATAGMIASFVVLASPLGSPQLRPDAILDGDWGNPDDEQSLTVDPAPTDSTTPVGGTPETSPPDTAGATMPAEPTRSAGPSQPALQPARQQAQQLTRQPAQQLARRPAQQPAREPAQQPTPQPQPQPDPQPVRQPTDPAPATPTQKPSPPAREKPSDPGEQSTNNGGGARP